MTGCLYGAVGLFALLLIGMLIVVALRFSRPPEPRSVPAPPTPMGVVPPAPAPPPGG